MCGIAGIVANHPLSRKQAVTVERMAGALVHRGPDGAGEYLERNIALAMRRLSVIDVAGGAQPLFNEDRSLALVCNGEIYNFVELRERLLMQGHRFSTGSDCETILHAYEQYDIDCVGHLRGMFAFALWDTRRRRLLLARDRMGEKPLYIVEHAGSLAFASELKALISSGEVALELSPDAIHQYFHYSFVPEPSTALRGVRKLPAGHLLTIDVDRWVVGEVSYWRMEDSPPLTGDPAELIRAELDTIGRLVIRSDVPVGVALSAGLDSSVVAALASRHYPGAMHAFSVGYEGRPPNDERVAARAWARRLGMPFSDVEITVRDMVGFFPELNRWRDDPIADIAGYGYYAVMRLASEHGVPVMLQGQGGDELFWGYPWLRRSVKQSRLKRQVARQGLRKLPQVLVSNLIRPRGPRSLLEAVRCGFGLRQGWSAFQAYRTAPPGQMVFYDLTPDYASARAGIDRLYTPMFREQLRNSDPAMLFTSASPLPHNVDVEITRLVCEIYLRENGVAQADRLSMASSTELRLPFLDHRLIETVIGLRKTQPDHSLSPKAWLKAAVRDLVPDSVMNRSKQGFSPPAGDWYTALFTSYGHQLIDGHLVHAGVLAPDAARQLAKGVRPPGSVMPLSFKALVLESWCRGVCSS